MWPRSWIAAHAPRATPAYHPAEARSPSASASKRWCGRRARSASAGLPVPISRSRNPWRESAHTSSPSRAAAVASPTSDLPVAVAPTMATTRGAPGAGLGAAKAPVQLVELEAHERHAAVRIAVGARGGEQAVHQPAHLGLRQRVARLDRGVAGERARQVLGEILVRAASGGFADAIEQVL